MALNLVKQSTLNLVKKDGSALKSIRVELSWSPNRSKSTKQYDLDVISALCKNSDLDAISDSEIAFFNQQKTTAITVSPDSIDGAGDGVDEFLVIDLNKVPQNATHIPVIVTIYDAIDRGQNFSHVEDAKVDIINNETGEVLGTCNITEEASNSDLSLLVGVIKRNADDSFTYEQVNEFFNKSFQEWIGVLSN